MTVYLGKEIPQKLTSGTLTTLTFVNVLLSTRTVSGPLPSSTNEDVSTVLPTRRCRNEPSDVAELDYVSLFEGVIWRKSRQNDVWTLRLFARILNVGSNEVLLSSYLLQVYHSCDTWTLTSFPRSQSPSVCRCPHLKTGQKHRDLDRRRGPSVWYSGTSTGNPITSTNCT